MSDTPMKGWWQASDGKWYPPEQHPNYRPAPPPPAARTQRTAPPKPKRRKLTWFILGVNALFLVWVISGATSNADNCANEVGDMLKACQAGTEVGTAIGVGLVIFLWMAVDVILGVIWLVTNRRN